MTIRKRFSFFKAMYDITRWDNNVLEFRTISFWRSQYQCQVGKDMYGIYGHRGRKYSIYKNDQQVAWWDKEAVSWFAGDNQVLPEQCPVLQGRRLCVTTPASSA